MAVRGKEALTLIPFPLTLQYIARAVAVHATRRLYRTPRPTLVVLTIGTRGPYYTHSCLPLHRYHLNSSSQVVLMPPHMVKGRVEPIS